MRLLLLSDIHANLAALDAALSDARRFACEQVLSLGDVLGYGPQPREVLARLREVGARCVLGNHDDWTLDLPRLRREVRADSSVARAIEWQAARLTPEDRAWVASWPTVRDERFGELNVRLRHGSPASMTAYVDSLAAARDAFAMWSGRVCVVGHTHLPGVHASVNAPTGEWVKHQALTSGGCYPLPPQARFILNPGSVGQPRDGDARASYAVLDTRVMTFEVVRVEYDVNATRSAIHAAGLPDVLGERLKEGR